MKGGKGAAIGGVAGGVVGAIAGAALAGPVLVGALVGGLAAKLKDGGFDDSRLKAVGDQLPPGSSAIIAVVEHRWVEDVEKQLAAEGADVASEVIGAELAAQLESEHDAAFTALATEEGIAVAGVSAGEDSEAGAMAVIDRDEAAGVEYVATKDGVVVHAVDATAGGVIEGVAAIAPEEEEKKDE